MQQIVTTTWEFDTQAQVDAQIAASTGTPPQHYALDKAWQYFCTKLGKYILTIIFILTGL